MINVWQSYEQEYTPYIRLVFMILVTCSNTAAKDSLFDEQGPNLQNILRQSYDILTIMPKLRSTYDGHLICKTSYKERKDFLGCNSLAKS